MDETSDTGDGTETFEMLVKGDEAVEGSLSESENPHSSLRSRLVCPDIGHVVKTIVLGMATNLFDVYSDVGSGLHHKNPKNVTRLFMANDTVPEVCVIAPVEMQRFNCLECVANLNTTTDYNFKCLECIPLPTTPKVGEYYECQEQDISWAVVTFSCIQLPAVVLAVPLFVGAVFARCSGNPDWYAGYAKMVARALLLTFIPFPLLVFPQQVASLFVQTNQMEFLSAIFLFLEGALEASPQLLLLLYIIISDRERDIPWIQKASIISSLLTISKTSIELFVSESFCALTPSDITSHKRTCNDSLLKGKSLGRKLLIMAQVSPAFIFSLVFKVGSIAIICALLKFYAVIPVAIGIVLAFIVAFKTYSLRGFTSQQAGSAIFYSLTNTTIVAKCFLENRKHNYRQMMAVSKSWLIVHSTTLVGLAIWVGALPESTHLYHWSSHHFILTHSSIFYPTVISILLLGPLSIIALRVLKKQVLALEEKETGERKFWEAVTVERQQISEDVGLSLTS